MKKSRRRVLLRGPDRISISEPQSHMADSRRVAVRVTFELRCVD
jgi:hypothetical protein